MTLLNDPFLAGVAGGSAGAASPVLPLEFVLRSLPLRPPLPRPPAQGGPIQGPVDGLVPSPVRGPTHGLWAAARVD